MQTPSWNISFLMSASLVCFIKRKTPKEGSVHEYLSPNPAKITRRLISFGGINICSSSWPPCYRRCSLPVPHSTNLSMAHLLLKLEYPVHECLRRRRASRDVDINRHYPITAPGNTVAVVIITSSVRARSHRYHPSGVGHLIIDLSKRGSHFVGQSASNDHNIGLTRRSAEYYS